MSLCLSSLAITSLRERKLVLLCVMTVCVSSPLPRCAMGWLVCGLCVWYFLAILTHFLTKRIKLQTTLTIGMKYQASNVPTAEHFSLQMSSTARWRFQTREEPFFF